MSADLTSALAAAVAEQVARDPRLAEAIAAAIAPYLPERQPDGWMAPQQAAEYVGVGSLDALDRLVAAGLPHAQPHGPGTRRLYRRSDVDAWLLAERGGSSEAAGPTKASGGGTVGAARPPARARRRARA